MSSQIQVKSNQVYFRGPPGLRTASRPTDGACLALQVPKQRRQTLQRLQRSLLARWPWLQSSWRSGPTSAERSWFALRFGTVTLPRPADRNEARRAFALNLWRGFFKLALVRRIYPHRHNAIHNLSYGRGEFCTQAPSRRDLLGKIISFTDGRCSSRWSGIGLFSIRQRVGSECGGWWRRSNSIAGSCSPRGVHRDRHGGFKPGGGTLL